MRHSAKPRPAEAAESDQITPRQLRARLDAVIMLLAGMKYSDDDGKLRIAPVAKLLQRAGFRPTEVARFFGKTKATDVSKYLY